MTDMQTSGVPVARVEPDARARWVWLIPAVAGIFALVLVAMYVVKRGPVVTVSMRHGHGLKAGDVVRARGVVVGRVEDVRLAGGHEGLEVEAHVRLEPSARDIARSGSRFWVVRPTVTLGGVTGLETIAGPRYMAVIPSTGGERLGRFIALDEPPVVETIEPDGLEIVLHATRRASLQPGAPVMYRQVVIGTVLSVGLSSDAVSVEVRAYIRPAYANLVRGNSVFWNASGVAFEATLRGLRFDLESLQSLVEGGVAMATPTSPGQPVHTGHRFELYAKAQDEWHAWRPALAVGSELLPAGAARPDMQRVTINRRTIFRTQRQLTGWALPLREGLLGPADLLMPGERVGQLEVAGESFEFGPQVAEPPKVRAAAGGRLAVLEVRLPAVRSWPAERIRSMEQPEDCLIIADPAAEPIPLPAMRLRAEHGGWRIDRSVSLDQRLHGAVIVGQSDGKVVGLLIVERGTGFIAPALTD